MATIHANGAGDILRVMATAEEELRYPTPPTGTAATVTFDEHSNAGVLDALRSDWNAHRVSGGKLQRNGVDVTIAPDSTSSAKAAFKLLRNLAATYSVTINTPDEIRTKYDDLLLAINSAINTARSQQNAATLLAQYKSATDDRQRAGEDLARAASLYNLYQDRRSAGR